MKEGASGLSVGSWEAISDKGEVGSGAGLGDDLHEQLLRTRGQSYADDTELFWVTATETRAPELAKLLYWLMVVGYSIRNIEVRFDMERVLGAPVKLAELPPGENI
ncbi:hypothetical protein H6P81_008353 [Aristolochia fimbriata]|uniref:Uncharacterized protein n=1 Tax=Aristolochia fimbriata TaxID=158543 RepID=A0AAV7F406_ARIFI|nr:hypothetical protein H6P81_008353 [Aristolochia fimbriata]